ncbi:hypothetical protein, partial [Microvirga lenta]|uniref:hypothetical protein n=1 Tax=Microvirga lenta TaxID=2881337 RepID=UPI001CFF60CF
PSGKTGQVIRLSVEASAPHRQHRDEPDISSPNLPVNPLLKTKKKKMPTDQPHRNRTTAQRSQAICASNL